MRNLNRKWKNYSVDANVLDSYAELRTGFHHDWEKVHENNSRPSPGNRNIFHVHRWDTRSLDFFQVPELTYKRRAQNFSISQSLSKYEWEFIVNSLYLKKEEAWNFSKFQRLEGSSEFFEVPGIWRNNMKNYEGIWRNMKELWRNMKKHEENMKELKWIYKQIWRNTWKRSILLIYGPRARRFGGGGA